MLQLICQSCLQECESTKSSNENEHKAFFDIFDILHFYADELQAQGRSVHRQLSKKRL